MNTVSRYSGHVVVITQAICQYRIKHGQDMPVICDWHWGAGRGGRGTT
ncbi:MAG: hypothetical protein WAO76_04540 [Georgfuchsia sp.]